ncbi:glycosyltransferase family 4 protein [Burkholderia gladioli]|uniref:glycosyltransferase family 4 protein n=1 Tax=Burkholderia gladioli TaxID=28095 RepID=UPI001640EBAC|nr:glycosyltransferase family 1 protein [Burkholderia gladioli]
MNGRIVVNVTASANWRRRPVGIIRVERELVKQIRRLHSRRIEPVILDVSAGTWRTLGAKLFDDILEDDWVLSEHPESMPPIQFKSLRAFKPDARDKFISVGSDWSFDVPSRVKALYGRNRVLIPALYDLIPLLFPEFTPGPEFFDQFNRHYRDVAELADSVFSISEHSKQDLIDFWRQAGISSELPNIQVVPLAGLQRKSVLPELSTADHNLMKNLSGGNGYVLLVSTLEPRKNHQLMLDIWRELHLERGGQIPRLVFVGMRGWGADNMIQQMSQMNATREERIVWLQGVSDDLLMHLYANALFAVLPSHYEGWGLAATEAATFGKICVTSNNSALKEATAGLSPCHHPLDFPAWKKEIYRLIDDEHYRGNLESRIVTEFIQRSWDEFGNEFSQKML